MTQKFFDDKRPHNGIDYPAFMEDTKTYLETINIEDIDEQEQGFYNYKKLNLQRSNRVHKTFKPDAELKQIFEKIDKPQLWMVITEDWCGDSAQNLPYLYMLSELSDNIMFKILRRDDNLDVMDLYLTNGTSRSIPILVSFDEVGNELFRWGPRPRQAQEQIELWKSEGKEKLEFMNLLHLWYAKNRGSELLKEMLPLIENSISESNLQTV